MSRHNSEYQKRIKAIEDLECPTCGGLGYEDDAELGDTKYNQWVCRTCNGRGMVPTPDKMPNN